MKGRRGGFCAEGDGERGEVREGKSKKGALDGLGMVQREGDRVSEGIKGRGDMQGASVKEKLSTVRAGEMECGRAQYNLRVEI